MTPVREVVSLWAHHCGEVALIESAKENLLWLPSEPVKPNKSYAEICQALLEKLQLEVSGGPEIFFRRLRTGNSWWQNVIFRVSVVSKSTIPSWVAVSRLNQEVLRSDEIASSNFLSSAMEEVSIGDTMSLYKDLRTCVHQVFDSAQFTEERLSALAATLLDMIWPCEKLHWSSFLEFVEKTYAEPPSFSSDIFRVCCQPSSRFARPFDVLCALACLELTTAHGDVSGEMRCRFIFRFYDRDDDGFLSRSELTALVRDVEQFRSNNDPSRLKEAVAEAYKAFNLHETAKLSLGAFLSGVGKLQFRGTSALFRAPSSVFQRMDMRQVSTASKRRRTGESEKSYTLALHTVRVRRTGAVSDVLAWWDVQSRDENQNTGALPGDGRKEQRMGRSISVNAFNETNHPNELLVALRYFEHEAASSDKFSPKLAFSWGGVDKAALANCIMKVCESVYNVLLREDRLLRLRSPTYILGDIHGNYRDLLCFEKALWRMGPVLTPCTFLFLGDFVDRGPHSIEVIAHLFSNKVLAPEKFYLLRGNHEIRSVQKMFGFFSECCQKFGDNLGMQVWEAINQCFDAMPLAAVIDEKLFCVHGGIPPDWLLDVHGTAMGIEAINHIPKPLPDPEEQSQLAWELMWSDPVSTSEETSPIGADDGDGIYSEDFRPNPKRRTAHMFSTRALDAFLNSNELSHVIRAHEVKQAGFQVQQRERLLTVFSSSHYCGGSNEAACVLADRHKLRMIRLDTS